MQVSVVLVNWNQSKVTTRCVESIFEHTEDDPDLTIEVIIVDNHSEKTSLKTLENYLAQCPYPNIRLIKNASNAGFAGGNNAGIREVLNAGMSEYIWVLNNDIIVQKNALNSLVRAAARQPEVKIWGSTIYEVQPSLHLHCAGGFRYNALLSVPTPITFPGGREIPAGLYYPLPEMDYPAGAAMFIRAETFRESGLFNETYFLYYEELDFVYQIGGIQHLAWCPDSILHHQAGTSTGSKNPNKGQGSRIAHYYGNLSALKFTWLYHKAYFPVVFLFRLLAKSALFIKHRDLAAFAPLKNAYLDFFRWLFSNKRNP